MSGASPIFARRSAFQHIELWRNEHGELELTLDRVWQFHEREEARFHAFLADAPAVLAPRLERALILGGGDGLAARNLLRYPQLKALTLVELDPEMLAMSREVPEMVALNDKAFADPRLQAVADDALRFVADYEGPAFDVIICDFPAPTHPGLAPLFGDAFYQGLRKLGGPDLVVAVQASCPPPEFWRVHEAVRQAFAWTLPLLAQLDPRLEPADSDAWANFVIASAQARAPVRESLAPHEVFDAARLAAHELRPAPDQNFLSSAYGALPEFESP